MKYLKIIVATFMLMMCMNAVADTVVIISKYDEVYQGKLSQELETNKRKGFFITHVMASDGYFVVIMEK